MNLLERLNTFPVIAAAALILAGMFGIVIGLATADDVSPVMRGAELQDLPDGPGADGGPLSALPRGNRPDDGRTPKSNRRDPAGNHGSNTDPTETNPGDGGGSSTQLPPVKAGEPRKLPEGRKDELVTTEKPEDGAAIIEVKVEDINNNPIPFALLALDIQSGPLGWQVVGKQPIVVPETRGIFRFEGLYAGDYRVRSQQANYKPVAIEVRLVRADGTENVSMVLEPFQYSQVEFFVKYEDGEFPEEVELRIGKNTGGGSTNGRFGEYEPPPNTQGGVIPPTRYRQRTSAGGLVKLTLPVGDPTEIEFSARRNDVPHKATVTVIPQEGVTQQEVILLETNDIGEQPAITSRAQMAKLVLGLTVDGKVVEFTRVNLYQDINDFKYRQANTVEGNKYTWQNMLVGKWYVVAESASYHAPFVQLVDVGTDTALDIDIKTGHLRVNASRVAGTPDPVKGECRYRVRLRPMGSGTIERAYNGNLTGKQSDFIDFYVPVGECEVRMESPEQYPKLSVSPEKQSVTMTAGGELSLSFNVTSASTLRFQAVNQAAQPIASPEYLVTFHAAGSVPESEKANVKKGGHDGRCESTAPAGPAYLMIWTTSTDWNNPDKVLQINLPHYETLDLGAVVTQE